MNLDSPPQMKMNEVDNYANGVKNPAREAGASIEPGVERGFASGTPGSRTQKMIEAREAGASERESTSMLS